MNSRNHAASGRSHLQEQQLLLTIKERLPELEKLLNEVEGHCGMEDTLYRYYHQSFKVFSRGQWLTEKVVTALKELLPERKLNEWFTEIVAEGTGRQFTPEDNQHWPQRARPILEALFHAHFFLRMVCKYGRELEKAPQMMPSGWAAVLYLYDLR
jgi:hypothetical protein